MEFTIKINGLDLSKDDAQELSRDLNRLVMHRLAKFDVAVGVKEPPSTFAIRHLINGGEFVRLNKALQDALRKELKIGAEIPMIIEMGAYGR